MSACLLGSLGLALPAAAQCAAKRTECSACHDGLRAPIHVAAPWHRDHGFTDLCVECHAGDPSAKDDRAAHLGMVAPLGAVEARCGACHADAASLADGYRAVAAPPGAPLVPGASARPREASRHGDPTHNLVAVALAGLVASGWAAYAAKVGFRRPKHAHYGHPPPLRPRTSP